MEYDNAKLEWLEYTNLEAYPHVLNATFTRHGGVSCGRFTALNLGSETSDKPNAVKINREHVRKKLDLPKIVYPHQIHGDIVHRITAKNVDTIHRGDALFTTEKNIGLAAVHADCQAAIFYDPVHEAIAVAHCGWRGSVQNIYARVIETLKRDIGTQPHNLIVCVSPSLGPDHAEFTNYKQELPREFWPFVNPKKPLHFDFWKISKMQLLKCGVLDKNIEIEQTCTFCNTDDYFSHRAEKDTGRNATIIALKG